MLKPTYQIEAATVVMRWMSLARMLSLGCGSPLAENCTAWSKLSELMPELS